MNRISFRPDRIIPIGSLLGATLLLSLATSLSAQRGTTTKGLKGLAAPIVRVNATPLEVTVVWRPVADAVSHSVEWATSPSGPWTPIPVPPGGSQVTMPSSAGSWNGKGGTLYYYRVSAIPELGEPGVTVVPRVTPQLEPPLGVGVWQEGADARVTWVPVPHATGYVVTVAQGQQLPPSQSVEASSQQTEARLINVARAGVATTIWVAVSARYGTVGATSVPWPKMYTLADLHMCWPPSSVPGPTPSVSTVAVGPTAFTVSTAASQSGKASLRVERAVLGSQLWQAAGCGNVAVIDQDLTHGTQYQYRVSELMRTGTVGQSVVTVATPPAPDSPVVTATIGACSAPGCPVSLNWIHTDGADEYRIESSYGLYRGTIGGNTGGGGWLAGSPVWVSLGTVPSGGHTFLVTPLFRRERPSPKPPAQVTVRVP
jgi:hypothetical protein